MNYQTIDPNVLHLLEMSYELLGVATEDVANHPLADKGACAPLDKSFVAQIQRDMAIHEPIDCVVWPGTKFLVVCSGRTRLRAAIKVGLETVPIRVIAQDSDDPAVQGMMRNFLQNFCRRAHGVAERADAAARMIRHGFGKRDVAAQLNVTTTQVDNYVRFTSMIDDLRKVVESRTQFTYTIGTGDDAVEKVGFMPAIPFTQLVTAKVADPTESEPNRFVMLLKSTPAQQLAWVKARIAKYKGDYLRGLRGPTAGREFGARAMQRFADAFLLAGKSADADSEDVNVQAIRTARAVIGGGITDDFARGIIAAREFAKLAALGTELLPGSAMYGITDAERAALVEIMAKSQLL